MSDDSHNTKAPKRLNLIAAEHSLPEAGQTNNLRLSVQSKHGSTRNNGRPLIKKTDILG